MKHPLRRHRWHVVSATWIPDFPTNPGTQAQAICMLHCGDSKTVNLSGGNLTVEAARRAFPRRTWR